MKRGSLGNPRAGRPCDIARDARARHGVPFDEDGQRDNVTARVCVHNGMPLSATLDNVA